jgi:hypothetical protein
MRNYLRVQFFDDKDGTGKLCARAESDGFSGESAAYFSVEKLESFAKSLQEFPLQERGHSIAGAFGSREKPHELEQEHLAICVYPVGSRGYAGIQVRMATPVSAGVRPESKKQAILEIPTTYEPLSKFSRDLLAVLRGSLKEALLEGESSF